MADDFTLTPTPPKMPNTEAEKADYLKQQAERPGLIVYKTPPVSSRAATGRILAQRRLANMHRQKPPEAGTYHKCGDCQFYERHSGGVRAYGKCKKSRHVALIRNRLGRELASVRTLDRSEEGGAIQMAEVNLPLFDATPLDLSTSTYPANDHVNRATMFHLRNPQVMRMAVELARYAKSKGLKRYSTKAIWEWMRFKSLESFGDKYKLNNSYTAWYARTIMEQHPDLRGFLTTRESPHDADYHERPMK